MLGTTLHIPTLQTERLTLRAPRFSDFPDYAAFRGDPTRTLHLGGPSDLAGSFDKLGEIIGHWHLRGYGRFLVADKASDAPLGVVGPFFPPDWPEPEIAWSMFATSEGRGLAAEAAIAARAFAYETLGWSTAISMMTDGNQRSIALAKRLGCTREADYLHPVMGAMQVWRHPAPLPSSSEAIGHQNKPSSSEAIGHQNKPSSSEAVGHQNKPSSSDAIGHKNKPSSSEAVGHKT